MASQRYIDPALPSTAPMNDPTPSELGRREWRRVPSDLPATLISGRESLRGRLVDISVGGALFECARQWVRFPGPCVLRLPVRCAAGDYTAIRALVVRTGAGRFGLRWAQRIPAHALIKLALPLAR
jgi:hypothetical protein